MNREEKQLVIDRWHERFSKAQAVMITNYQGLNAHEMGDLRRRCHEGGVDFVVLKNTLAKLALKETPFENLGEDLKGPVGWAVGYTDEVEAAKVITKYSKDSKNKLEVLGGGIIGKTLDAKSVEALSKLPGRNEMRATFLNLLNAVPTKFVRTLNEIPAGLARSIDKRRAAMENN